MKKTVAIIPGSFDPVTLGHIELVKKSAEIFDTIYFVAMINPEKDYLFFLEERLEMMRDAVSDIPGVVVDSYEGMLYDYANEKRADAVIKGIRTAKDAEYELWMSEYNNKMCETAQTILFTPPPGLEQVSSTLVREMISRNESPEKLVTDFTLRKIMNKMK